MRRMGRCPNAGRPSSIPDICPKNRTFEKTIKVLRERLTEALREEGVREQPAHSRSGHHSTIDEATFVISPSGRLPVMQKAASFHSHRNSQREPSERSSFS